MPRPVWFQYQATFDGSQKSPVHRIVAQGTSDTKKSPNAIQPAYRSGRNRRRTRQLITTFSDFFPKPIDFLCAMTYIIGMNDKENEMKITYNPNAADGCYYTITDPITPNNVATEQPMVLWQLRRAARDLAAYHATFGSHAQFILYDDLARAAADAIRKSRIHPTDAELDAWDFHATT